MKLFFALLVVFLTALSVVSAGTISSAGSLEVRSNFPGLTLGNALIATWEATPAVNDEITISNADLPPPYGLQEQIFIEIPPATIEQTFSVNNQRQLFTYSYVERRYNFGVLPLSGSAQSNRCEQLLNSDLQANYGGRTPATSVNALLNPWYCDVQFVIPNQQIGWMANLNNRGIYYKQFVNIDGKYFLTLERSDKVNDLVATQSGVARVSLLNFGTWTNAQLTERNIYAYHEANVIDGTRPWKPFSDNNGFIVYDNALAELRSKFDVVDNSYSRFQQNKLDGTALVATLNAEATRLRGKSGAMPTEWSNVGEPSYRTVGNTVVVPLKKTVLVPRLQVVIVGERFGLFIPVGEPKIVSVESTIKVSETNNGLLKYRVKNEGKASGTFVVSAVCENSNVVSDEDELKIAPGATISGTLQISAKAGVLSGTQRVDCELVFRETQSDAEDRKDFRVDIEAKANCIEGQETDPVFDSDKREYTVQVLSASCSVKSEKVCALDKGAFVQEQGVWVCKARDGTVVPQPERFNSTALIISLVIAAVIAGAASIWIGISLPLSLAWRIGIASGTFVVLGVAIFISLGKAYSYIMGLFRW